MKNIISTLAKTAVVLLSITSFDQMALANDQQPVYKSAAKADITVEDFIRQAKLMGMKEVQLSGVANEKSTDPKIKAYAKMIIDDHTKANEELKTLAKAKNVTLPMSTLPGNLRPDGRVDSAPENMKDTTRNQNQPEAAGNVKSDAPNQESEILRSVDDLKKLSGSALDQAYIVAMIADHQKAIALFEEAAKSSDAAVRKYASKQLPKLKAHLKQANTFNL
ncbi:DUF4142 domain-containing protein [Pedobacter sp. N23S346]|uniref:DUF4142 domain-containing protein n=1 Tax=Pedobacter sp. N23S346 TaxID=3402750 RepID=UPI003ACF8DE8